MPADFTRWQACPTRRDQPLSAPIDGTARRRYCQSHLVPAIEAVPSEKMEDCFFSERLIKRRQIAPCCTGASKLQFECALRTRMATNCNFLFHPDCYVSCRLHIVVGQLQLMPNCTLYHDSVAPILQESHLSSKWVAEYSTSVYWIQYITYYWYNIL